LSGFGSGVAEVAVAVFVNTVPVAVAGVFITNVKVALALAGSVATVHVMVPPDPTGGTELQSKAGPLFWLADTKVIPTGISSVSDTFNAVSVPRFVRTTVNETLLPGAAEAGPLLVTCRSAPAPVVGCVNRRWTASDTRGTTMKTSAVPRPRRIAPSRRIRTDIIEILPKNLVTEVSSKGGEPENRSGNDSEGGALVHVTFTLRSRVVQVP
jgi:hypothetical protein